ncbi:ral guanine nucleotide dissociation stimulator-like [Tupaia chinensis]|uniref:ral guanine nucleotide dissociation stimulator-like n=1 Tax=Tupaia chinensis TaxID=246437 RepID=UPI0003C91B59|nr:ral guanine nucleotide dissociation stimulator-like [Tupaia chinensis]
MFLHCVPHSHDSDLRTHRAEGTWQRWRHWVSLRHRDPWTFAWKKPKNESKMATNQEKTGYSFLQNYCKCGSTQQLLDQLFMKYGCILPYSTEDSRPQDQLKKDMYSILATWVDQFSEDFQQPPDFLCLKLLLAYVTLNMPGSDLEHRSRRLLAHLESSALRDADPQAPGPSSIAQLYPLASQPRYRTDPRGCVQGHHGISLH